MLTFRYVTAYVKLEYTFATYIQIVGQFVLVGVAIVTAILVNISQLKMIVNNTALDD